MHSQVSCVIPGASHSDQVNSNAKASNYPDFSPEKMDAVRRIYDKFIRQHVHHCW